MVNPYRIVLVDDHLMFRQGIKNILEKRGNLKVIGEVGDGLNLLDLLKKETPDMIILDISMPSLRRLEAICEAKIISQNAKILVLSMHKNEEYVYRAISIGSHGYLLKEDADTELFAAIEKIRQGGFYVSPNLFRYLTHKFIETRRKGYVMSSSEPLTIREQEVLKLVSEGISSKEIADLLSLSVRTVEHHRANIMKKLNIKRTANLVKYAIRKGYTSTKTDLSSVEFTRPPYR
jgi:DNA-binding NarL/FixJ family response regulator